MVGTTRKDEKGADVTAQPTPVEPADATFVTETGSAGATGNEVRKQTAENRGRGQTKIAVRPGHAFRDPDMEFDVDEHGVYVTKDEAARLIEAANAVNGDGYMYVVEAGDED